MKQATLVNLPTELLCTVFYLLDSDDLLNIAMSCHRLNLVAIPVFMEREGSPDHRTSSVVNPSGRYADEITALNLDFSLIHMKQFFCILVSDLTWNIRRVIRLITRLSSIGSVSLVIDSWDSRWSLQSDVVQKIVVAVLDLVETAISKACTSFQIIHYHPAPIETDYQFEVMADSKKPKMQKFGRFFMKSLFLARPDRPTLKDKEWGYRQLSNVPTPRSFFDFPTSLHTTLTKLDLSSDLLLIPPYSTWTFAVMKSSPIDSLSLRLPNQITEEEYQHYLFPMIVTSLPKLREIKLALLGIEFLTTVAESLSLLPFLETITLGLSFRALPSTSLPITHIGLLHLTSFTGSSDQAAYMFGSSGFSCPNLEFINIIVDTHFHPAFDNTLLEDHLATLDTHFHETGIEPCISVCLANEGELPDDSGDGGTEQLDHLSKVSRLTLELPSVFGDSLTEADVASHAMAWLELFRGVTHLTLLHRRTDTVPLIPKGSRAAILSAINSKHQAITTFNLVDLPNKFHYHWSNARDDWQRGTDRIPTTTNFDHKSTEPTVCSHF
ncbi:hypothetical protein GALMADRAFT_864043 [Galerina marginata CBS 339.88]|uniref:F-box domain-containing protein n=1 Tax=Galerina marginata (strain CBS 339.88) TaxID=685588 RepID=A0A067TIR8_GALM3|nr:hypothetical protein GALMADRAFT_864043 [Galerina marginata CBS 339.88]